MENFSGTNEWLTFMDAVPEKDEFLALKKELTKLRLEAKLRKSLSAELTRQKSITDTGKTDTLSKSQQLAELSANSRNTCHRRYTNKSSVGSMMLK